MACWKSHPPPFPCHISILGDVENLLLQSIALLEMLWELFFCNILSLSQLYQNCSRLGIWSGPLKVYQLLLYKFPWCSKIELASGLGSIANGTSHALHLWGVPIQQSVLGCDLARRHSVQHIMDIIFVSFSGLKYTVCCVLFHLILT